MKTLKVMEGKKKEQQLMISYPLILTRLTERLLHGWRCSEPLLIQPRFEAGAGR